eukprot:6310414-Pyramimonas_sp.AAC.1
MIPKGSADTSKGMAMCRHLTWRGQKHRCAAMILKRTGMGHGNHRIPFTYALENASNMLVPVLVGEFDSSTPSRVEWA